MGIRQLNKILKRVAPSAIIEKSIHCYIHSKIAIDSSILIYKYRYAAQGSDDSHIYGFIQRVCFYLKRGILPVFVFDGIPPDAKKDTLEKRVKQKSKIETRISQLINKRDMSTIVEQSVEQSIEQSIEQSEEDYMTPLEIDEEISKLRKQVTYVTKSHRQECKYLLKLLGIPVIESSGEAETTCAAMQKHGIVDYTFTEDTDALTFGAPKVLKTAKKMERVIEINLGVILEKMELSMDSFIDFCILCGCDYCPTIPKIGPITALTLINKYSNIENIIENLDPKYIIPDNFDYVLARSLFKHDPLDKEHYDISIKDIQLDKLKQFIINEKGLSDQIFDTMVNKYNKALVDYRKINKVKKQPQQSILSFFSPPNSIK